MMNILARDRERRKLSAASARSMSRSADHGILIDRRPVLTAAVSPGGGRLSVVVVHAAAALPLS